jgi:hypothetical protein
MSTKNHLNKATDFLSNLTDKLPEVFILIAIPIFLIVYLFFRDTSKNDVYDQAISGDEVASVDIEKDMRTLVNDAERDLKKATDGAVLDDKKSIQSAKKNGTDDMVSGDIASIDLIGPWRCEGVDKSNGSLYIKDKNVVYNFPSTDKAHKQIILTGGCFYEVNPDNQGVKQCNGVEDAMSALEFVQGLGLSSISESLGGMIDEEADGMIALLSSCHKGAVDDSVFDLPKNIKWVEDTSNVLDGVF